MLGWCLSLSFHSASHFAEDKRHTSAFFVRTAMDLSPAQGSMQGASNSLCWGLYIFKIYFFAKFWGFPLLMHKLSLVLVQLFLFSATSQMHNNKKNPLCDTCVSKRGKKWIVMSRVFAFLLPLERGRSIISALSRFILHGNVCKRT